MTDLTPTDIAAAVAAKYEATEGERPSPEVLLDAFAAMAEWTVKSSPPEDAAAVIETVKRLALAAAPLDADHTACDNCEVAYSLTVVEAADDIIPPPQVSRDANGDPDVGICGFCILDADEQPDDFEAMSDRDWEQEQRWAEEDEASIAAASGDDQGLLPGDTPADRDAIVSGLGWHA